MLSGWLPQFVGAALACGFSGHALVSLGFSPSYKIHLSLVNWFGDFSGASVGLTVIGFLELAVVLVAVAGFFRKQIRLLGAFYLIMVAMVAGSFFAHSTGGFFGFTEVLRRVPWLCMLYFLHFESPRRFSVLRLGVLMMFLSHGLASLTLMGFNGMHVELASQLLDAGEAERAVKIAGYTDLFMALGLALPHVSRYVAYPAFLWIAFIVVLSFGMAFPDGLFRLGFLLCALTLILEPKTHQSWFGP